jgi:hypothetical protein
VISDPEREPVLERAMPADAVPGSTIAEDSEAEVLLRDGSWVWCQVVGQRKDRHGRWCVGVRWYASSAVGGREGWFLYDPAGIRRPGPLGGDRQGNPVLGRQGLGLRRDSVALHEVAAIVEHLNIPGLVRAAARDWDHMVDMRSR